MEKNNNSPKRLVIWSALLPEVFVFLLTPLFALLVVRSYLNDFIEMGVVEEVSSDSIILSLIPFFVSIIIVTIGLLWLIRRRRGGVLMQGVLYLAIFQGTFVVFQAWVAPEMSALGSLLLVGLYAVRPWVWLHNLVLMVAITGIGVMLGVQFSFLALIVLSMMLMVYDAFAVLKSRHMVTLVKGMASQRVFLGFMFPYERARYTDFLRSFESLQGLSFLGTGDLAVVVMLVVGASFISYVHAIGVFVGACVGFATLLAVSYLNVHNRMYPGLPFIVIGALLGLFLVTL